VCENFAKDFCVKFTPTKSMCMFVSKSRSKGLGTGGSYFTLDGSRLSFVDLTLLIKQRF